MPRQPIVPEFELERDLVAVLQDESGRLSAVGAKSQLDTCHVFSQVQVHAAGLRIPDLIFVYSAEQPLTAPDALTYFEASVLSDVVEHAPTLAVAIAGRLFVSNPDLQKRLDKLERLGLIGKRADGSWSDLKAVPKGVRVVAIEAKLSRWNEAAGQASQYFRFAHEAYIAMPPDCAHRPKVVEHCATLGVGVLSVQASGDVSVVLPSDARKPKGPEYFRLLSATIGVAAR